MRLSRKIKSRLMASLIYTLVLILSGVFPFGTAVAAELVAIEVVAGIENGVIVVEKGKAADFKINLFAERYIFGLTDQVQNVKIHTNYKISGSTPSSDNWSLEYPFSNTHSNNYSIDSTVQVSADAVLGDYKIKIPKQITPTGWSDGYLLFDWFYDEITIRVVDYTAPTVTITSPANGSTINNLNPVLEFEATDNAGVSKTTVSVNDGVPFEVISGATLSGLQEGQNKVLVEAFDEAGNKGSSQVNFTVDATAPTVVITDPAEGSIINNATPILKYTNSEGVAKVILDGNDVTGQLGENGELPFLNEGEHTIKVVAVDNANNSGSDQVSFKVDTTKPTVVIQAPSPGLTNNKILQLKYTTSDGQVKVKLDGNIITGQLGQMGELPELSEGLHKVVVEATDEAGNIGFDEVEFTVDLSAPKVTIESPIEGSFINDVTPTFNYTVSEGTVKIFDNGQEIKLEDGKLPTLKEGLHTVVVEATDEAGNKGSAQIKFTVDLTAPTVTINSPLDWSIIKSATPVLDYSVTDGDVKIILDGVDITSQVGIDGKLPALAEGQHTVKVEAKDQAGNLGYAEHTFSVEFVSLSTLTASPQLVGTKIRWNASAEFSSPKYAFYVYKVEGTEQVEVQKTYFNTLSYFDWTPKTAGTYKIKAVVRDLVGKEYSAIRTFVVNPTALKTLTANTVSPKEAYDKIRWTAEAEGVSLRYSWYVYKNGNLTTPVKTLLNTYTNYFDWTPTEEGNYNIKVVVTDLGGNKPELISEDFEITPLPSLVMNDLLLDKESPQLVGTKVRWTADATGKDLRYAWQVTKEGSTPGTKTSYLTYNYYDWTPKEAGNYTVTVFVKDISGKELFKESTVYTVTPTTIEGLEANLPIPQNAYTKVRWTAYAKGVSLKYSWYVYKNGGETPVKAVLNTYTNYFDWTPEEEGDYNVKVVVTDLGGNKPELISEKFVIGALPELSVSELTYDKESPQFVGSKVRWTANATGKDLKYAWVVTKDGVPGVKTSYLTYNYYDWTPKEKGTYNITTYVKDISGKEITKQSQDFVVKATELISFGSELTSPQEAYTKIRWTADTVGVNLRYSWYVYINGEETPVKTILKGYNNYFDWTPTDAGNYKVDLVVSDFGENTISASRDFVIEELPELTISDLTYDKASPELVGTKVRWTANASGKDLRYAWQVTKEGSEPGIKTSYLTYNYYDWTPKEAGNYVITAYVKDISGKEIQKSSTSYIVKATELTDFGADLLSPQEAYTKIRWSAETIGVSLRYSWYVYKDGGDTPVKTIQNGYTNYFDWTPTEAGNYTVDLVVTDLGGNTIPATKDFTITEMPQLTVNDLTYDKASPQIVGTKVRWTANASGKELKYAWQVTKEGSEPSTKTSYLTYNYYDWMPKEAGTYSITVFVKDISGNEKQMTQTFVVSPTEIKSLTADPENTASLGTKVRWTADTLGVSLRYSWYVYKDDNPEPCKTLLNTYTNYFDWVPDEAGTYKMEVIVTDLGGNKETKAVTGYQVTIP